MSNHFQELLNRLAKAAKNDHLQDKPIITLGALRELLEAAPKEAQVKVQWCEELRGYGGLESYRGYYSDLSINIEGGTADVQQVLNDLNEADGDTFTGYKGGEYTMDANTLMWADFYSCCSNQGVTGIIVSDDVPGVSSQVVIIQTGDCS